MFTPNFEIGMGHLYNLVESGKVENLNQLQKDMSIFFSRFLITNRQRHLYSRLARLFHKEMVSRDLSLLTLDYGCLLEWAILGEGISMTYADGPGAEAIKPHGSCNFFAYFPNLNTKSDVTFQGGCVDCNLKIVNPMSSQLIINEISLSRFPRP